MFQKGTQSTIIFCANVGTRALTPRLKSAIAECRRAAMALAEELNELENALLVTDADH